MLTDTRTVPEVSPEQFERICAALDADLLTDAYSDAEVDAELAKLGLDPEAIGQRGKALVLSMLSRQTPKEQEKR